MNERIAYLERLPRRVVVDSVADVEAHVLGELRHELGPWRDHVRVPGFFLLGRHLVAQRLHVLERLLLDLHALLGLLRGAETTRALLVHLGTRRDAIDGQVEHATRAHGRDEAVDVLHDAAVHLLLGLGRLALLRVRARVDEAVHVDKEVVDLKAVRVRAGRVHEFVVVLALEHDRAVLDAVDDAFRVLLLDPAVERGDAHGGCSKWELTATSGTEQMQVCWLVNEAVQSTTSRSLRKRSRVSCLSVCLLGASD